MASRALPTGLDGLASPAALVVVLGTGRTAIAWADLVLELGVDYLDSFQKLYPNIVDCEPLLIPCLPLPAFMVVII